ncbi:MAG: beta-lactamase family protein, partial [Actinobacteria bacterium]|nr:beta-lactamase family protein [Actinomycetota bacterium]
MTRSGAAAAQRLEALLAETVTPGTGSAAVLLASAGGETVASAALGTTRVWDAPGAPTAAAAFPVTVDTPFDLASVTKPFVAAALLTELDAQRLDPSLLLAEHLPEFREPALRELTVAHLLSHTAGFPASWPDHAPDPGAIRFRATARPVDPPGSPHRYSCLSFIWAGLLAEALAGISLDELVAARVLTPLGLRRTGYRPAPELRPSIAATEWQPGRGMVQGEVHDETAFALGGVSGNAGLFGTAPDLLRFAGALRTGDGLAPRVHAWLTEPAAGVAAAESGYRPTLGLRSDEAWCAAVPGRTVSHTGFTGTAFLAEPGGDWSLVLLSNRVHPSREQGA